MDAKKERFGAKDLKGLLEGAKTVVVAKGKKVLEFDLVKDAPAASELAGAMLGPSGNLRAPALRVGKTWLVGFHPDAYSAKFG